LVLAARSDSRSSPEGGSVNAGVPHTREPPQSRAAPQAKAAEAPFPTAAADMASDAGGTDLLGDPPAEKLYVPLGRNPTPHDLDYFARQFIAMLAEAPNDGARAVRAKMANEYGLGYLKAALPDLHAEVQAAINAARRG
jgi:hypothetical protein